MNKVIAVEEHFMIEDVNQQFNELFYQKVKDPAQLAKASFIDQFVKRGEISEIGEKRIQFMDEHGIDVMILSYGNNSPMYLEKEYAVPLCKKVNDELAAYCTKYPGRFYGFATIPVSDVNEAVKELERAVIVLGLKGVMFNGIYQGKFFDEEEFFPIFEKAEQLGIPVMFHPGEVDSEVSKRYYQGSWPLSVTNIFAGHGIGWHYETGVQYLRIILSGLLDRLPKLKLICGHWGETLPFYFSRLNETMTSEVTGLRYPISEYFKRNMYLTPSGMFYPEDLRFCLDIMGADRILWATDYPYRKPENSREFLNTVGLSKEDLKKISYKNAEKLFGI